MRLTIPATSPKRCPRCRLFNEPSVSRCDCGWAWDHESGTERLPISSPLSVWIVRGLLGLKIVLAGLAPLAAMSCAGTSPGGASAVCSAIGRVAVATVGVSDGVARSELAGYLMGRGIFSMIGSIFALYAIGAKKNGLLKLGLFLAFLGSLLAPGSSLLVDAAILSTVIFSASFKTYVDPFSSISARTWP